ncbi:MAG: hypothetical protein JNK25_15400 [Phycisphaerae bacterium]|nr:hypothetical protein [Phycisphaerae bacterium]
MFQALATPSSLLKPGLVPMIITRMTIPRTYFTAAPSLFVALATAFPAAAQSPSPRENPALIDPSEELTTNSLRRRPENVPPVEPNQTPAPQRSVPSYRVPDASANAAALPAARVNPEGTLLRDLRGTLAISEQGDVILVPLSDSNSPLFVLLPSQRVAQMTAARAASGPQTRFLISGQVFVYRDREFLLPSVFAVDRDPATPPDAPASSQPIQTPATDPSDPRVEDLMRDLESHRLGQRRLTPAGVEVPGPTQAGTKPTPEGAPSQVDPTLRPEGTLLVSRRGRLVRLPSANGRLAFVIDNDPDSPAGKPLILQPCHLLERMEALASARGEDISFRVSGRITVFEGRNYLLPTFQQAIPHGDLTPMQ